MANIYGTPEQLDQVFKALADSSRRSIVAQLATRGELSVSEASENLELSPAGVSKHLRVLEDAGVISRRLEGRRHVLSLESEGCCSHRTGSTGTAPRGRRASTGSLNLRPRSNEPRRRNERTHVGVVAAARSAHRRPPHHRLPAAHRTQPVRPLVRTRRCRHLGRGDGTDALGGRLELRITFPGTDLEVRIEGFYEVIEPPTRLVHTWRSMDEELVTTVSFEVEPQGNQTRLRVIHRGFVDPVDLEQNQGGWTDHLSKLAAMAADLEGTEQ